MHTNISKKLKEESHADASKKRNIGQRIVVEVKVEAVAHHDKKKQKSELGAPSDSWSWRKYGQKSIKGSPYPRGYYRCSTSKSCTAKKQVERCRTDSSMLVVTYTSTHNHPGPDGPEQVRKEEEPKVDQETVLTSDEAYLHYSHHSFPSSGCGSQYMISSNQDDNSFKEKVADYSPPNVHCPSQVIKTCCKSANENDFYDELGELPTTSSFTQLLRTNFIEERILLLNPF